MLWRRKQNNIIQSVKTTYIKNADKREMRQHWSLISEKQLIPIGKDFWLGWAMMREVKTSSIYEQNYLFNVTLVALLYGVLCTMYHRMQKLQSAAEERNLVQELLLRAESSEVVCIISRTEETKQLKNVDI